MTDLPKEDRDLIERVLGKDEVRWLARIGCNIFSVEMVAKLLAAARSEGRAEAPVVDEGMVERATRAAWDATHEPQPFYGTNINSFDAALSREKETARKAVRAALLAALGASQ